MKNILLLLSLFVLVSFTIDLTFDGCKRLHDYDPFTMKHIIETTDIDNMAFACERLSKIGGKKYNRLMNKEAAIITEKMMNDAIILFPDKTKKEKVEKQLRNIFWYSWWLEKHHIVKHFWASVIFTAIDKQNYYPKHDLKIEFVYHQYYKVL